MFSTFFNICVLFILKLFYLIFRHLSFLLSDYLKKFTFYL